jgi:hypothetical protein
MWYSQSYGIFNGRGAPGFGSFESPPHSSFAYQGVIAAMPPAVTGTRPDWCQPPVSSFCFLFETGFDVKFNPPPPPPPPPTCDPNEEQFCTDSGGRWDSFSCSCIQQCGLGGECSIN